MNPPLPTKHTWKTVKSLPKPDNTWIVEHFQRYAVLGIATFPIIDGPKIPPKGSHGHLEATTDQDEFLKLLERTGGQKVGLGARMGDQLADGGCVLCLDVDEKNGKSGSRTLKGRRFDPPPTLTATTRSDGRHYLYRTPHPVRTHPGWLGERSGLDIKGTGGWIAVAPTTGYAWGSRLGLDTIAEAPGWLMQRTRRGKGSYRIEAVLEQVNIPCPLHKDEHASCWLRKHQDGRITAHCFAAKRSCSDAKLARRLRLDGATSIAEVVARLSPGPGERL